MRTITKSILESITPLHSITIINEGDRNRIKRLCKDAESKDELLHKIYFLVCGGGESLPTEDVVIKIKEEIEKVLGLKIRAACVSREKPNAK